MYLRDGWGPLAPGRERSSRARDATVVLPCLHPRPLAMTVNMESAHAVPIGFSINARPFRHALVGPGVTTVSLTVPGDLLFRGDNLLGLGGPEAAEAVTLRSLSWSASPRP